MSHEVFDCHVHIGRFYDSYYHPQRVVKILRSLGVRKWAVMSTSTFTTPFDYKKIEWEFKSMHEVAAEETYPILMVTPDMLLDSPDLKKYFSVPYCALKIHGHFHPWESYGKPIRRVLSIARALELPVMLHSGGQESSDAGAYADLCSEFSNVPIILAHGRPIDQALQVMKACGNVFIDTAFMPLDSVKTAIRAGMSDRIIFGTDLPINKHFFPRISYKKWYDTQVFNLLALDPAGFRRWTKDNFVKLFIKKEI